MTPIRDAYLVAADSAVALISEDAAATVRRHGKAALLRALTRAERAPASITAF